MTRISSPTGKKLLIALPVKTTPIYTERMEWCKETWLKDSPVDWKGFTDEELGLIEIDQHDNANDPIRTWRTKLMSQWAYDNGYDYMFRVDNDAYVWLHRLLACGFEKHDYQGWCLPGGTAHGGIGFFLSRKALSVVKDAPIERYRDGKFWGDLWAGTQLKKAGIDCHRDTRFLDGSTDYAHHGNIFADELPLDHPYISIHPVGTFENMKAIHERFKDLPTETVPPQYQFWHVA